MHVLAVLCICGRVCARRRPSVRCTLLWLLGYSGDSRLVGVRRGLHFEGKQVAWAHDIVDVGAMSAVAYVVFALRVRVVEVSVICRRVVRARWLP